jgi:hypothetical protein
LVAPWASRKPGYSIFSPYIASAYGPKNKHKKKRNCCIYGQCTNQWCPSCHNHICKGPYHSSNHWWCSSIRVFLINFLISSLYRIFPSRFCLLTKSIHFLVPLLRCHFQCFFLAFYSLYNIVLMKFIFYTLHIVLEEVNITIHMEVWIIGFFGEAWKEGEGGQ